jgi:hypothetical protein
LLVLYREVSPDALQIPPLEVEVRRDQAAQAHAGPGPEAGRCRSAHGSVGGKAMSPRLGWKRRWPGSAYQ